MPVLKLQANLPLITKQNGVTRSLEFFIRVLTSSYIWSQTYLFACTPAKASACVQWRWVRQASFVLLKLNSVAFSTRGNCVASESMSQRRISHQSMQSARCAAHLRTMKCCNSCAYFTHLALLICLRLHDLILLGDYSSVVNAALATIDDHFLTCFLRSGVPLELAQCPLHVQSWHFTHHLDCAHPILLNYIYLSHSWHSQLLHYISTLF